VRGTEGHIALKNGGRGEAVGGYELPGSDTWSGSNPRRQNYKVKPRLKTEPMKEKKSRTVSEEAENTALLEG